MSCALELRSPAGTRRGRLRADRLESNAEPPPKPVAMSWRIASLWETNLCNVQRRKDVVLHVGLVVCPKRSARAGQDHIVAVEY